MIWRAYLSSAWELFSHFNWHSGITLAVLGNVFRIQWSCFFQVKRCRGSSSDLVKISKVKIRCEIFLSNDQMLKLLLFFLILVHKASIPLPLAIDFLFLLVWIQLKALNCRALACLLVLIRRQAELIHLIVQFFIILKCIRNSLRCARVPLVSGWILSAWESAWALLL